LGEESKVKKFSKWESVVHSGRRRKLRVFSFAKILRRQWWKVRWFRLLFFVFSL